MRFGRVEVMSARDAQGRVAKKTSERGDIFAVVATAHCVFPSVG